MKPSAASEAAASAATALLCKGWQRPAEWSPLLTWHSQPSKLCPQVAGRSAPWQHQPPVRAAVVVMYKIQQSGCRPKQRARHELKMLFSTELDVRHNS